MIYKRRYFTDIYPQELLKNVDKKVLKKFWKKAFKHSKNSINSEKRVVCFYTQAACMIAQEEATSLENIMKEAIKDFNKFKLELSDRLQDHSPDLL